MNLNDLKIYLPKFLSADSEKELFNSLKDFPSNMDERLYTRYLQDEPVIYQGDGLKNMLVVNLPDLEKKEVPGIILSNTCDIDPNNKRNFPSQIIYAPIIDLNKYAEVLKKDLSKSYEQIESHLEGVRKQFITQIFYLPAMGDTLGESIVFLDRIYNIGNDFISRNDLKKSRLFTLSNYGIYLFLFKLSLHFTRIQDSVDRKSLQV